MFRNTKFLNAHPKNVSWIDWFFYKQSVLSLHNRNNKKNFVFNFKYFVDLYPDGLLVNVRYI